MYRGMYTSRDPYSSELHHLIRENYRQVFFNKEIRGTHLPFHLEREFKKYLICGNLAFGMARFHCSLCQKDKLVAFSCKGRTLCPSCTGRRMSDTAKHLIEEVIPEVPTRQWVLSMPYAYRFSLARNPDFLRKALAISHRTLSRHYEYKARIHSLKNPKAGAITVVQRFGGALNLNVHFHTIYIDGVFYENDFGVEVFFEIVPTHKEVVQLNVTLKKRLTRLLEKFEHKDHFHLRSAKSGTRHKKRSEITSLACPKKVKTKKKVYRTPWSELLKYVFKYEVSNCDHCGTKLTLVATITSQNICQKILNHLGGPANEMIVRSPRAPPEVDFLNQTVCDF